MAMAPIYLTEEQREKLTNFAKNGTHNSHLITRANILLVLDRTGKKDHMRIKRTADTHGVSRQAVYNIIKDFHNSKNIDEFTYYSNKFLTLFDLAEQVLSSTDEFMLGTWIEASRKMIVGADDWTKDPVGEDKWN